MQLKSQWKNRKKGCETPFYALGLLKLRIPFVHYRFEAPDFIQGLLMCAVDLAAIPLITEVIGAPFEVALAIVILNGFLYLIHHLLGDPVIPGWITPAIPLVLVYVKTFPENDRVHALVAFQMILGILSVLLGITKLATKTIKLIPSAIKSGVVLGAGLAAVNLVFKEGGRFESYPFSISIVAGIAFYLIFSKHFATLIKRKKAWALIAKLGIFPIIALSVFLAPFLGETPWPNIKWGLSKPNFALLFSNYTIFGLGIPPLSLFISSMPTVIATYIILFGDVLQSKAILKEAYKEREDEKIDYNPNRAHFLFGIRNFGMSIFGPDIAMCGPLWAAMHVVIVERYKQGKKAMDSIFGGSGSFRFGTNLGLLLLPIVSLVKPVLGIALALTLLIQGYVSVRVGILEAQNQKDLGIAGIIAALLITKGATWAFITGFILCFLIYGKQLFKNDIKKEWFKDS
ncbi:MAG: hypothetical protein ACK5H1_05530 [Tenacibaculum sp.]